MPDHDATTDLFAAVRRAAPSLAHPETVRALIMRALPDMAEVLNDAAFKAKFLVKSWDIMRRVDPDDETGLALKKTFTIEMESARALLRALIASWPVREREAMENTFLRIAPESFVAFLELLRDMSWIQNVMIDRRA